MTRPTQGTGVDGKEKEVRSSLDLPQRHSQKSINARTRLHVHRGPVIGSGEQKAAKKHSKRGLTTRRLLSIGPDDPFPASNKTLQPQETSIAATRRTDLKDYRAARIDSQFLCTPLTLSTPTRLYSQQSIMNPPNPPHGMPPPAAAPARPARQIRGPQSALTDFLASQGINANQIRQDADARRAAARVSMQTADGDDDAPSPEAEPEAAPARKETKAQAAKRKKEEEKAIAKIKASKQFQRRRKQYGSDDDVSDEDDAARAIFEESMAPLPGQMENCETCEKRFSVTAYSRTGPDGGLLCPKCSKDLDKEDGSAKKKRKIAAGRARRQLQSNLLDGIYPGAKDLMTLCIETLAKNVQNADSLGDISDELVDKIAAILSKKRLMTPETLYLFLRPGSDTVTVYDAAKLSSDDFIRIFQIVPKVKHLRLRNAIQFKNKVMDHLLGTTVELETLSLHGSNLIDDERWNRFLTEKGSHLRALKVYSTDGHFGDEQLEMVAKHCPNLQRLKVCHNQKVTVDGIDHISKMNGLTHLSLELYKQMDSCIGTVNCASMIGSIGPGLRTLSLATIHYLTDGVLEEIHQSCQNLSKLRLTDNSSFTDDGFAKLFTGWLNHPLVYLDFHKCRHIDAAEPRENPNKIGLGSTGFEALMAHSGSALKHLNVHSCRHISREAFENVFALGKTYPEMQEIDISFCQSVNDFVVGSIFRSCPNLKTLKVFGNFGVREVRVPKGKILIGVPNALGMQIEGTEGDEGRVI